MLEVRRISVRYGSTIALSNISFELKEGLTALVGPNGSGKTTLLKALAGLVECEGDVLLNNLRISELPSAERRKAITYIPPYVSAMPELNIGDLMLTGESIDLDRLNYYVKEFGLEGLLNRRIWEVSAGELQRSLLARGLSRDSAIYAVDEPFSHTDIKNQLIVLKELRRIAKMGKLVIVASNQLNPILGFSDSVIALKKGKMFFKGSLSEFLREDIIGMLYEVNVKVFRSGPAIGVVPLSR